MNVLRYNRRVPTYPKSLFDQFFSDFNDILPTSERVARPSVNVKESDKAFELELLAPGFSKDEVTISLENEVLTVRGQKEIKKEEEKDNYTRREFAFSTFERHFQLPENTDLDNIEATFENGVLKLSLAKLQKVEKNNKKVIEIG